MTFEELIENIAEEVRDDWWHEHSAELVVDTFKEKLIDNKDNLQEVKHGEWIFTGYYGYSHCPIYECTNCHESVEDNYIHKHKWCLHCGARMNGVKQ